MLCCAVLSRPVMSNSATPWTAAHQAPLSMGFSRQEYCSGLPCPPPGYLPNWGIESRSPASQANSLLSEPPGKPKNTGVGSLSLLQENFLTQEWNWGLLHCRWILYQLSHPGSPQLHILRLNSGIRNSEQWRHKRQQRIRGVKFHCDISKQYMYTYICVYAHIYLNHDN